MGWWNMTKRVGSWVVGIHDGFVRRSGCRSRRAFHFRPATHWKKKSSLLLLLLLLLLPSFLYFFFLKILFLKKKKVGVIKPPGNTKEEKI
jgi:hypothetical protein